MFKPFHLTAQCRPDKRSAIGHDAGMTRCVSYIRQSLNYIAAW
ncbi:hypothetical protein CKO_05044 [Citrobacter koseri ATCC BAA-895]|uniref:Uncharacterized protein n=1 Tax=Citrobacter koseri (strain ATCC BAA-895 / CDC 4225-83 / SGSC4696) TaxID=290338 RepID=A8ARH4_CITK8|nr:hypothetical protein CKO_05044 [Citrobacter koseri ATCC BAA-895]